MKNNKIFVILVLVLLVAVSIILACCMKPADKHFAGIRVIFFNGGPLGDSFASVVYNGAKAAERDLGCKVEYFWSDWNTRKMALQFKEAIDKMPDAICMMGHPGAAVLGPLISDALRQNIIVTLQNVDLPNIRKQYLSSGFGYVGQDLYVSGLALSRGAVRKFNLSRGEKALVVGPGITEEKQALNERAMRTKGCIDGLEENGLIVYALALPLEVENNPKVSGLDFFSKAIARYPDISIIITDHGAVTAAMPKIMNYLGKKPGEIFIAGFDLGVDTVAGIQSGYIGIIHDQQPYLQGYLSVLQACLAKKYGFAGLYIDTGVGLIDSSNIEKVGALAKKQIR
jgi:simple sugar transport system substrate-binding protein